MSLQLSETLHQLKEVQELEVLVQGQGLRSDTPVFRSPLGFRWDERNLERLWSVCLKETGIRQIRFHDLRHTYASLLIEQGAHPKYIQEQMGHSSIQVTMDTYGHLFPNRNGGMVDSLDSSEGDTQNATQAQPPRARVTASLPNPVNLLARPEGLEPPTPRSVVLLPQ
jgi:integrase